MMDLLTRVRSLGKQEFECEKCGRCCHLGVPLFLPDLASLNSRVNLSKLRSVVKVYLSPGQEPPKGIRLFLDSEDSGDGAVDTRCPFLDENNRCSLYENRPIACRVFPLGQKVGKSVCPRWEGRPNDEMAGSNRLWREEEKKILKQGAENYYRRWLNLLYPKGYIPPSAIKQGVYWSGRTGRRL